MKIATFNANSIRSRLDVVLDWLEKNRPDVLCIQETKVEDKDFPADVLAEPGYHVLFRGEKSYNGVALLSRVRPAAFSFGFDDGGPADDTRLVYARVGPLHVVNTYVPQGREITHALYRYKLEWFRRLASFFERHFTRRMRLVWTGDLNVAPEPEDIHNAEKQKNHVCFHRDVREAYRKTVQWGFTDVFRKHHPEPGQYTFFDYRTRNAVQHNMGWRIDHILATPPLARRSRDAYIDLAPRRAKKPSDHTFLVAEFED